MYIEPPLTRQYAFNYGMYIEPFVTRQYAFNYTTYFVVDDVIEEFYDIDLEETIYKDVPKLINSKSEENLKRIKDIKVIRSYSY